MSANILLVAPDHAAGPVATALRRELDAEVTLAAHRRIAIQHLQRRAYTLVLLEEGLTATDPEPTDALYEAAGATPVVEANFVISSASRIVRQVGGAMTRRAQDHAQARTAATAELRSELNGTLAGLLLESQLALRAATPEMQPKLRHLVDLASDLRERLRA